MGGSNVNLESRAIGSSVYASRGAGMGAQKDLGAAAGLSKTTFKPNKQSGAYARGPKV